MNRWNKLIFLHVDTDSQKLKAHQTFIGWDGQEWVWLVWSWGSKIDCILKLNRWNKLIFCMLVQIQDNKKLIQSFLGGPCQKWQWLFGS